MEACGISLVAAVPEQSSELSEQSSELPEQSSEHQSRAASRSSGVQVAEVVVGVDA